MSYWISPLLMTALTISATDAGVAKDGMAEARRQLEDSQYEEAEASATKLLDKNDAAAEARLIRARARFALGRYEAALWDVEELLRSGPKPEYYHQRAVIRLARGQLAEAFADLARAADLDHDEVRRAVKKATTQMMLFPASALKTLDVAIALHPKESELYSCRADVQIRRGDFDRALADARTARDRAADDPVYHARFVQTLLVCNRGHAARDEATAALKRFPRHAELYGLRTKASLETDRVVEATADAERFVQLDATNSWAHRLLANCHVAAKRYGEAILDYQTADGFACKEMPGSSGDIWSELSRLLSRCPDDAVRDGKEALRLAELARNTMLGQLQPGQTFDTLASAYAELGQFDKAVEAQQQAVQWAKNSRNFKPYSERLDLYKQGNPCRESKFER